MNELIQFMQEDDAVSFYKYLRKYPDLANSQDSYTGNTILMIAVIENRNVVFIHFLLRFNADKHLTNHQGETAADIARTLGYEHLVHILS